MRLVGEDFSNQSETKTDKTTTHVNHVNNNSGSVNRFLEPQPCTVFRRLDFNISNTDAGGSCNFPGLSVNIVSMDSCSACQPSDAGEKGLNEFLHCGSVETFAMMFTDCIHSLNLTTSSTLQVALQRGMDFRYTTFCTVIP